MTTIEVHLRSLSIATGGNYGIFADALRDLGAECVGELAVLTDADLVKKGIPLVKARNILAPFVR